MLYHGSPNRIVTPQFGLGEDRHDYGKGFYLTQQLELAKEWAVCRPETPSGYVHTFALDADGLTVVDFEALGMLHWLAELMKHRAADTSKRYRLLSQKFIARYGVPTDSADIIKGWRADASYFYIAKAFVRDEIDVEILDELLMLGGLGVQWCIKSPKAYAQLHNIGKAQPVNFHEFNQKYNQRDVDARTKMKALVESDRNKVEHVFSTMV